MAVFLDDDFVDGIEAGGDARRASSTASTWRGPSRYLRSNDLIYQPAIRSYMMGETPPGLRPALLERRRHQPARPKMAVEYLRGLCQGDRFAHEGFPICGETVRLAEVDGADLRHRLRDRPHRRLEVVLSRHPAMGSTDKTFILSESGHIAGIVNPPSKGKYGHWTNPDLGGDAGGLARRGRPSSRGAGGRAGASGWRAVRRDGARARSPGDAAHPALAPAPGTYVTGGVPEPSAPEARCGNPAARHAAAQKVPLKCCTAASISAPSQSRGRWALASRSRTGDLTWPRPRLRPDDEGHDEQLPGGHRRPWRTSSSRRPPSPRSMSAVAIEAAQKSTDLSAKLDPGHARQAVVDDPGQGRAGRLRQVRHRLHVRRRPRPPPSTWPPSPRSRRRCRPRRSS